MNVAGSPSRRPPVERVLRGGPSLRYVTIFKFSSLHAGHVRERF